MDKIDKMHKNGQKWTKMDKIVLNWTKQTKLDQIGKWKKMVKMDKFAFKNISKLSADNKSSVRTKIKS